MVKLFYIIISFFQTGQNMVTSVSSVSYREVVHGVTDGIIKGFACGFIAAFPGFCQAFRSIEAYAIDECFADRNQLDFDFVKLSLIIVAPGIGGVAGGIVGGINASFCRLYRK